MIVILAKFPLQHGIKQHAAAVSSHLQGPKTEGSSTVKSSWLYLLQAHTFASYQWYISASLIYDYATLVQWAGGAYSQFIIFRNTASGFFSTDMGKD